MNKEDKVMTYATAFCMVSAGVLMLEHLCHRQSELDRPRKHRRLI